MVTKEDGASIIAAGATARGSIWASMKWDMPASDGSIKYELWSHSNDENAYECVCGGMGGEAVVAAGASLRGLTGTGRMALTKTGSSLASRS